MEHDLSALTINQYELLLGKIYDAAMAPHLWSDFLEQTAEIFQSQGMLM